MTLRVPPAPLRMTPQGYPASTRRSTAALCKARYDA